MEWIKASERLPEGRVICRWNHAGNYDWPRIDILDKQQIEHPDRWNYNIEWLDESESSPSTVWPGIEEIIEAHAQWFGKDPDRIVLTGINAWIEAINWLKSHTAGVPEISFPDMKCTCIGEVLQKWGITPLAELVDEIEDVMWSRTVGEGKEKWDDSASLEDQIWALKVINNLLKNELLKQSRTAPDQPEQEEEKYFKLDNPDNEAKKSDDSAIDFAKWVSEFSSDVHVKRRCANFLKNYKSQADQPEQFSKEDMFNAANEYAIVSLDSGIGHADFEKWITEYIKNKK